MTDKSTFSPSSPSPQERENLRERLAALAHEQWSGWMKYLFSRCEGAAATWASNGLLIPIEWVKRWERQMHTPFVDLSEVEKNSDREEADRMIAIFAALAAPPEGLEQVEAACAACEVRDASGSDYNRKHTCAAPPEGWQDRKQICSWRQDADGIYHTTCKHTFYFDDDSGAIESGFTHCAYCGNVLTETRYEAPLAASGSGETEK